MIGIGFIEVLLASMMSVVGVGLVVVHNGVICIPVGMLVLNVSVSFP